MKGILCAVALALAAGSAQAAVVYLKEGGHLDGAVVSATETDVILDTAQGRVRIAMDQVQTIDYSQAGATPAPSATTAPAPAPAQTQAPAPTPGPGAGPYPSMQPPPDNYRPRRRRRYVPMEEPLFEPPRQMLSIDLGFVSPMSNVGLNGTAGGGSVNNGETGPSFGIQYLYFTTPKLGLGFEFHDYERSSNDSTGLLPSAITHVSGESVLMLGVMKYSLTDRDFVRPFVLLGAGAGLNSLTIDAEPVPGFAWNDTGTNETRRLVNDSEWGFAASARLGLDFGYGQPGIFSLEAGWTMITSANYRPTAEGQEQGITGVGGPLNYFTIEARWGFGFF